MFKKMGNKIKNKIKIFFIFFLFFPTTIFGATIYSTEVGGN
jgi:hypothetical protein